MQTALNGQSLKYKIGVGGVGVSVGYWALFRFELLACYHPNIGIFLGVWLFQKKISPKIKLYPG